MTDILSLASQTRSPNGLRLVILAALAASIYAQQSPFAAKTGPAEQLEDAYPEIGAVIRDNLARSYIDEGLYEEAQAASSRSVELARKIAGRAGALILASSLTTTAIVDLRRANLRDAEAHIQQALAIRIKELEPTDPLTAQCLHVQGLIYQQLGDYRKAEESFRKALGFAQDSLDDATTRSSLAEVYMDAGRYAEAEPLLLAAKEVRGKSLPVDDPMYISSLTDLALLRYYQQDFAGALVLDREIVNLRERNQDGDVNDTARAYSNLADVLRELRIYTEAEQWYQRAVSILKERLGPNHRDVATAICNLGGLYARQRDYDKAAEHYQEALSIREKALGTNDPLTLEAVASLAELFSDQGRFAESIPLYSRSLQFFVESLPFGHPNIIAVQIDLGRALWMTGHRQEAVVQLMDANRSLVPYWSNNLTAANDETRQAQFSRYDDLTEFSLAAAEQLRITDPKTAGKLAALAIAARKGILSSARQELLAHLRRERDPDSARLFQLLATNAEEQGKGARELLSNSEEAPKGAIKGLIAEETNLISQLLMRNPVYRQWRVLIEPEEIASKVRDGQAIFDVLRYPVIDPASLQTGAPAYGAVVYSSGGGPVFVPLGPAAPIEEAVRRLRRNFDNVWKTLPCPREERCSGAKVLKEGAEFRDNLRQTLSDCAALDALTIAKLSPAIGKAKELIISPDASLATIPWEILRDKAAYDGHYLIEQGYSIRYLDSVRSAFSQQERASTGTEIAVIAQIDYDGGASKKNSPAFQPLGGGEEIVQALQDLSRSGKLGRVQKLPLGSKQEVLALDGPAALIAHTHGFFPEKEDEKKLGTDAADLLSGIALYGANRAADGGRLTAKEAMLLNLDGTQLAALLGCETGLGWAAGEGVQGLRHALLVAGAKTTLLTLWDVGDLSSARFLREFLLRAGGTGVSQEEALAQTRLAFIRGEVRESGRAPATNRWNHPYFWAAATLSGEGGRLNLGESQ